MKGKELGKLLLEGLPVVEDGRLVVHDCAHVDAECIHVLANGDLVLLGLIPVRIKSGGESCTWFSYNTSKYTLVVFLNIIRVYYKYILKFFVIIILLSKKNSKPGICIRYKGKFVTCQNGTQKT